MMQKTYLSFEQGDIVVADLAFSTQFEIKRRPVLVISNSEFNKTSQDVIVLKITSVQKNDEFSVLLTNSDLYAGKLKKNSRISAVFFATIQKTLLNPPIAKINEKKLVEVKKKIKNLFGV
ncbi:MAG: type II toxin-antitoxin system PemK/MazF family toxin [Candidatus Diapherotrites archaeon]|nr:type II toxin-antitoxin system PemK/MazF family toxin [Candidatus Diapherotrites archaeon]